MPMLPTTDPSADRNLIDAAIGRLDLSRPDGELPSGERYWIVRDRIPFSSPVFGGGAFEAYRAKASAPMERVQVDPGVGLAPGATGDTGDNDEVALSDIVSGVASSTSVDYYGTEMSKPALDMMAAQMTAGIPYLPRHNNGFFGAPMEWDSIIGRTVFAEVVPAKAVKAAFDPAESAFLLNVAIKLYSEEELAQKLVKRVARGEVIGQSIGGWFTELQIVYSKTEFDDYGDPEIDRVIILAVELDHLAVTRAPANPDADKISSIRSRFAAGIRSRLDAMPAPFARHISSMRGATLVCDKVSARELLGVDAPAALLSREPARRPAFARDLLSVIDRGNSWELVFPDDAAARAALGGKRPAVPAERAEPSPEPEAPPVEASEPAADPPADPAEPEPEEPETFKVHQGTPASSSCARVRSVNGQIVLSFPEGTPDSALLVAVEEARAGKLGADLARIVELAAVSGEPASEKEEAPARTLADRLSDYRERAGRRVKITEINGAPNPSEEGRAKDPASSEVDADPSTRYAPGSSDAPGSAPLETPPTRGIAGNEERAMPDNESVLVSLADLRAIVREEVTAARAADPAPAAPAPRAADPAPAPAAPAVDWQARAEAAERALTSAVRGERVGRAVPLDLPRGPGARSVMDGLIERARTDSPALAAVSQEINASLRDRKPAELNREDLDMNLRSLCNAAEADGLIVDPLTRAASAWGAR